MHRILSVGIVAILCGLCAACGHSPKQVAPQSRALPFPHDHSATAVSELVRSGAAAEQSSNGAQILNSSLLLTADLITEFGVYRFNPDVGTPDSISVELTEREGDAAWIGLANFETQRWDFFGQYSVRALLDVAPAKYRSAAGNLWVAVVVPANGQAQVEQVRLILQHPANQPPLAQLLVDDVIWPALADIRLDASGSSDADGTIKDFEWDLNSNGQFNEAGAEADLRGQSVVTITGPASAGEYEVHVRVTDDDWAKHSASAMLRVANWTYEQVAVGWFEGISLEQVQDKPAISVHAMLAGGSGQIDSVLRCVRRADGGGWSEADVAASGWYGAAVSVNYQVSSLGIVAGHPSIAFNHTVQPDSWGGDPPTMSLQFARNDSADGSGAWSTVVVDEAGYCGQGASLAIVDGLPAISYISHPDGPAGAARLMYARCEVADGSADWTVSEVGPASGTDTSLLYLNDGPAIAYARGTYPLLELCFAYAVEPGAESGWTVVPVQDGLLSLSKPLLAVVDDHPAISFAANVDPSAMQLRYAHSSTPAGNAEWTVAVVDSASVLWPSGLLETADGPAVSYYRGGSTAELLFATSPSPDAASGWSRHVIAQHVSTESALADLGGSVGVAYTLPGPTPALYYATPD